MLADSERTDTIPIYPDETVEDLQRCGFRLLQKKGGFRFGLDSVLLAAYASCFGPKAGNQHFRVADLGAGCGAVSLLLAARLPGADLVGLELDNASFGTLQRNIRLNRLSGRLHAVRGDIRQLAAGTLTSGLLLPHSFDLVVSNPPYLLPGQSWRTGGQSGPGSRQAFEETAVSLEEILAGAGRLLKPKGRLVLVHRILRLPDVICALRNCRLEPKTIRLIQSLPGRSPATFLMSAVSQGRPGGFTAEPPLLVCSRAGVWSPETAALYGLELPLSHDELYRGLWPDKTTVRGDESDE